MIRSRFTALYHATCTCLLLLATFPILYAQSEIDSTQRIKTVTVHSYFAEQPLLRLPASAAVVSASVLAQQSGVNLVPAMNTVPGVRMEERSPGSYRLSIRGSLLRSPFGVRNIKVYMDEFPLTDAGGNTYLNLVDPGSVQHIEILKGPDGSLFGANSGGVVILKPFPDASGEGSASLRLNGGSYGLFHQQVSVRQQVTPQYSMAINQAFLRSDGYRQNANSNGKFFQTTHRWAYRPSHEVRLLAMYTDLSYRTPGGLTAAQYAEDPSLARPAAGNTPGALAQQAGISNKTFFGGLVHESRWHTDWKHVVSVFGTHTDFVNPFITNYEIRKETNMGLRMYLSHQKRIGRDVALQANVGLEWQRGQTGITNYDNHGGDRGAAQSFDDLRSAQSFYFARLHADVFDKLRLEAALSLNHYGYGFKSRYPIIESDFTDRRFSLQWMPRFAASYLANDRLAFRVSASKGYSPPTTAEVRSSDNLVNTDLDAEIGWNYEGGMRWQMRNRRIFVDVSVFHYQLEHAIVRQLQESGAEYFTNAGSVAQLGAEMTLSTWLIEPRQAGLFRGLQWDVAYAKSRFRFRHYQTPQADHAGNKLTGVPDDNFNSGIQFLLPYGSGLSVNYQYTGSMPLNDGNTVFADPYHLLQAKLSWKVSSGKRMRLQLFAGVDNLLDQRYSLGNDINAFGGRFFNAAAPRNFYGGLRVGY